jgi:iron(III) transport system substrate-binding protein
MKTFTKRLTIPISTLAGAVLVVLWSVSAPSPSHAQKQTLTVYSMVYKEVQQAIKQAFEAKHPNVTVNFVNPGGAEATLVRLAAERANPVADIFHAGGSGELAYAAEQGLLDKLPASLVQEVPDTLRVGASDIGLKDKQGYWLVWSILFHGLMYNEDRVKALNLPLPKSWEDLTRPEYKGNVLLVKPQKSSTSLTFVNATHTIFGSKVWDFWDRLDKNIPFYLESSGAIYSLVGKGEVPFGQALDVYVFQRRAAGHKVNIIFPSEGVGFLDDAVGIVKGTKNFEAAVQFARWNFSREGQELLARHYYHPIYRDIPSPIPEISLEHVLKAVPRVVVTDPKAAIGMRDDIMKRFDQYARAKTK